MSMRWIIMMDWDDRPQKTIGACHPSRIASNVWRAIMVLRMVKVSFGVLKIISMTARPLPLLTAQILANIVARPLLFRRHVVLRTKTPRSSCIYGFKWRALTFSP